MKVLYVLIVLQLVFISGYSQTIYPRLGVTVSTNTYHDETRDVDPKIGFLLGVGYDVSLTKAVSLQLEIDYIQKAFQSRHTESTSLQVGEDIYSIKQDWKHQYFMSYLGLPLLVKIKVLHDNIFISGGATPGIGLGGSHKYDLHETSSYVGESHESGKGKIKFSGKTPSKNEDVHFDNQWDLGVVIGVGASLFANKLSIECRYERGMVNLYKNQDSKNRSFQVLLSAPIQLGKKQ